MQFTLIGNPENRRSQYFIKAVESNGFAPPTVVSYLDLLQNKVDLKQILEKSDWLRMDSPGENFEVAKQFMALGAEHPGLGAAAQLSAKAALQLPFQKGRIQYLKQSHLGFCQFLNRLQQHLDKCPNLRVMNSIPSIQLMFDKIACHQHFKTHQISVAPAIYDVQSYDDLRLKMKQKGWNKVFIKPAFGSSASGVIAYRVNKQREQAISSTELVHNKTKKELYNSLKIRQYEQHAAIRYLIDTLAKENILVEQWIPKAALEEGVFDLRMVAIGGKVQHVVVRQSKFPMTNLHLGNQRGDLNGLKQVIGDKKWQSLCILAEQAANCLPNTLYTGLDMMLSNTLKNNYVLEANAFGDLLPNVLVNGLDTYSATIHYLKQQQNA